MNKFFSACAFVLALGLFFAGRGEAGVDSIINEGKKGGRCIAGNCSNGYGTFEHSKEVKYRGYFTNGEKNGVGVSIRKDGMQVLQVWRKGALVYAEKKITPQKSNDALMSGYTPGEYDTRSSSAAGQ